MDFTKKQIIYLMIMFCINLMFSVLSNPHVDISFLFHHHLKWFLLFLLISIIVRQIVDYSTNY